MRRAYWCLVIWIVCWCGLAQAEGPAFVGTCQNIAWSANTEPTLAGYRLYDHGALLSDVGLTTTAPCAPLALPVGQHAVQIMAYGTDGGHSPLSEPPVPFVLLAQAPSQVTPLTLSLSLPGGPTLPYSGIATVVITGVADSLALDRGAADPNWPAQWPTGSLSQYFTKTPTGWTFNLCLSCYPAPGNYVLAVTATNAAGSTTATLPITIGTVPPPLSTPVERMTVQRPSPTTMVITAPTAQCKSLSTSTIGSTKTLLKRTITCTP